MIEQAKKLLKMDQAIKDTEEILKYLKGQKEKIEQELVSLMIDQEVGNLSVEGKKIYLATRLSVSPKAAQREALYDALQDNGLGDLIKPTVNANTLTATVKELMEHNDNQLPEWLADKITLHSITQARIRKN